MASTVDETQESKPSPPKELSLDFLKKITNDFSDERKLGTGAFGSIYKGILEDGVAVAVKKLGKDSPQHGKLFVHEVQNIMALQHENIIKLVGFCCGAQKELLKSNDKYTISEITENVLCYEYLPNGSLDKHIYGESTAIDWSTRFKIIKGISRGIQFLHNLPKPILHLGLKPQSILLDDNMVPKIADFGYSRILVPDETQMTTKSVVGTVGYMAPEYLYCGELSAWSDIYSFGLIILEIVTRERNSSSNDQKHARDYIDRVKINWTHLEHVMYEYPDLEDEAYHQVEKCISIGLQCVEIDQNCRPSINAIVDMLEPL